MLQLEAKGILHCDLRAANVLINKKGDEFIVKLTDFGLSKDTRDINQIEDSAFPVKWTDVAVLKGICKIFHLIHFYIPVFYLSKTQKILI